MVLLLISVLIIAVVGVALQRTDWNRSRLYRTIAAMLLARADARDERDRVYTVRLAEYRRNAGLDPPAQDETTRYVGEKTL